MDKFPKYYQRIGAVPNKDDDNAFIKKYPQYSNVEAKTLHSILKTFNKKVLDEVLVNRNGVALPEMFGYIFIGTSKPEHAVNSRTKYKDNELLKYNNINTDGKLMKIFYIASATKIPMRHYQCWTFKAKRDFRRLAASQFEKNHTIYADVTGTKPNKLFFTKKEPQVERYHNKISKYNELDL